MKLLAAGLLSLFLAGSALADVVHLKSGGKLEGIAHKKGDKVVHICTRGWFYCGDCDGYFKGGYAHGGK